jgi:hypothetical protein
MNGKQTLCVLSLVFFFQTILGQCTEIPCVILIDGKLPGVYISNAYFEYQDSVKGAVKIPIKDISPSLIKMADTNLRKLEQLATRDTYFQSITLNFDFVERAYGISSFYDKYNLHYSCSFDLEDLMSRGSNVITFYNIDKEKGTYLYYYYLGGALGFSKNTTPYKEEKHRVFYNY